VPTSLVLPTLSGCKLLPLLSGLKGLAALVLPLAGVSGAGCRNVHSSRHPDGVHTTRPCRPNPTANALLSGAQQSAATAPVCLTVCPQSKRSRDLTSCCGSNPAWLKSQGSCPHSPMGLSAAAACPPASKGVGGPSGAAAAGQCWRRRCTTPDAVPKAMRCACDDIWMTVALRFVTAARAETIPDHDLGFDSHSRTVIGEQHGPCMQALHRQSILTQGWTRQRCCCCCW
jgi:hypothetical protein